MAVPFGVSYNSDKGEKKSDTQNRNSERENNLSLRTEKEKDVLLLGNCDEIPSFTPGTTISTAIYHMSNSSFLNHGSTFMNISNTQNKISDSSLSSSEEKMETDRRIEVRKGIFTSLRIITSEDIQFVVETVEDWKKLLKNLPGVTVNNLSFHQTIIEAMDRGESTNMAETALFTWKCIHPELSTIGNLAKALFSIGHPDIVTHLKP